MAQTQQPAAATRQPYSLIVPTNLHTNGPYQRELRTKVFSDAINPSLENGPTVVQVRVEL